jgi:hypothetical protein
MGYIKGDSGLNQEPQIKGHTTLHQVPHPEPELFTLTTEIKQSLNLLNKLVGNIKRIGYTIGVPEDTKDIINEIELDPFTLKDKLLDISSTLKKLNSDLDTTYLKIRNLI